MVSSVPPQAIGNQRYKPLTGFKWWFRPTGLRCLPEWRKGREGEEEEGELARGNERGARRNRAIAGWSETKTIATQRM